MRTTQTKSQPSGPNFAMDDPMTEFLVKEAPSLYPLLESGLIQVCSTLLCWIKSSQSLTEHHISIQYNPCCHCMERIWQVLQYFYYFRQQLSFRISAIAVLSCGTDQAGSEDNLRCWLLAGLVMARAICMQCMGCKSPLLTPTVAGWVWSEGLAGCLSVCAHERRSITLQFVSDTHKRLLCWIGYTKTP